MSDPRMAGPTVTNRPPAEATDAANHRADDFLAPALFTLIARVRAETERVGRLRAVPGRSGEPLDPDAIHDFRVALRRLRSVLRPARHLFGKRHVAAVNDALRRYAQATGALRDEEVLRETLVEIDLPARVRSDLATWLVQRARQERARRRTVATLLADANVASPAVATPGPTPSSLPGSALRDALAHLERRLGRRAGGALGVRAFAERALADAAESIAERLGSRPSDATAMHDLRIRYKRLRYIAELFAPILGEPATSIAKEAARMQKRLGELHDLDEALRRIRRARSLSDLTRAAVRRALVRARAHRSAQIGRDLADERALLENENHRGA